LIEAVKELDERIRSLEAEVAAPDVWSRRH